VAEIAAIATQNAASDANDLATAQAAAANAQATADVLQANQSVSDAEVSTAQAEAVSIQATLESAVATATVLAQQAANAGIDGDYTQVRFQVDAQGLINGDPAAEADAIDAIREAMAPYNGCKAGVALTFGGGNLQDGLIVADNINRILAKNFSETFGEAGFENFATVNESAFGQVTVQIYFLRGCDAERVRLDD